MPFLSAFRPFRLTRKGAVSRALSSKRLSLN
jgi:hypothetical protein